MPLIFQSQVLSFGPGGYQDNYILILTFILIQLKMKPKFILVGPSLCRKIYSSKDGPSERSRAL